LLSRLNFRCFLNQIILDLPLTFLNISTNVNACQAFLVSFDRDRVLEEDPRRAPSPVPTMIAVGVASRRASGQVITTTVIA
jgi:hypothetical protein